MTQTLLQFSDAFPLVTGLLLAMTGACLGSFLTMATYRLPREEPIGRTRSHCTACAHKLGFRDLFPILSWLFTAGKCRYCKSKVSWRYPLTELACAASCVAVYYAFGLTVPSLCLMGLCMGVIAIFITDLEHRIILDEVQVLLFFLALIYAIVTATERDIVDTMTRTLGFAFTGLMIGLTLKYGFLFLMNKDGLGLGDVKFLAVVGAWLASSAPSITVFVPFLFYSGILGIVTALLWRCISKDEHFPFGPALALSLLLCVCWPYAATSFFTLYGMLGHAPR